jgi:hypothetical protein
MGSGFYERIDKQMPVSLYACETWKTTNQITRLQTFINKCLGQIMNIK